MRTYLYLLAGLISALLGWNLAQFLLDLKLLPTMPELVLYPCVTVALAVGLIANEICISSPTRLKLSWRMMKRTLPVAAGLGLVMGLITGAIAQIIYLPEIPGSSQTVRIVSWLLIGLAVGIAEGKTWSMRSLEAGDKRRERRRFYTSVCASFAASLVAAILFEWFRSRLDGTLDDTWRRLEDPLGYSCLGLLLGLALSISSAPSYSVALRAGAGFEYLGIQPPPGAIAKIQVPSPRNPKSANKRLVLKFVSEKEGINQIEEGLSIQLPDSTVLHVGAAAEGSHIYLPGLPLYVADIKVKLREAVLEPSKEHYDKIAIDGERLIDDSIVPLKHNRVVTFYTNDGRSHDNPHQKEFYRFIFYNRFFDPQS